jgi:hypothetical protein
MRASDAAGGRTRAWREAEVADKGARHVALVREPAVGGGLGQASAGCDQCSCAFNPDLPLPFERRHPVDALEPPQQLVPAQADEHGQLRQRRRADELVGESLADSREVATRIERRRRGGVASEQQPAAPHQRFLATQGGVRRRMRSRVPAFEPPQELSQNWNQRRVVNHRARQAHLDRLRAGLAHHRRHRLRVEINHPPAARRQAKRPSVVHLAGIGRNHVADVGVDDAAPTQRAMGASLEEPEAERRMPVPVVLTRAVDVGAEDSRPR